jgi:hypothetical protein
MANLKTYTCEDERKIQIDVMEISDTTVICNLYTGVYCAKIVMSRVDYEYLVREKFFLKDGEEKDSANVWNKTEEYRIPSMLLIEEPTR